ncbi:hypothetical protein MDG893_08230 [Marinobacter algicola DG893]|uniref:Uncharacterized protein n=1 Tax=Marinobacter algicola DG893 TaxID=443152 RepID=A6EWI3_9GAMM|nr:hypothetical protein MDG893_08230 [Marinobacter algicola DG893]
MSGSRYENAEVWDTDDCAFVIAAPVLADRLKDLARIKGVRNTS